MLSRLLGMLKPHKGRLILGGILLLVATPLSLFHPIVWKYIVDDVLLNTDLPDVSSKFAKLWPALGVMMAVHYLGSLLSAARTHLLGVVGQQFVADLRARLHAKLSRQSLSYMQDHRSGDLMARVIGDVDTLQELVINGVDNVISNLLAFLYVAAIIVGLNWKVGCLTLVPLALVWLLVWLFNKRVKNLYRRIRDRLGDLSAHLQEHIVGTLIVKAFAREPYIEERFKEHNDSFTAESMKGVAIRAYYFPAVMAVGFLSNLVMIGAGAYYVIVGEMKIGVLVAYRGYWWQLFSPVQTLAQVNEMVQRAKAAAARVFEVLDAPETIADTPHAAVLEDVKGHLRFEDVAFAYVPERPVLKKINLEILPGQQVGVVGPSGAGKSTVLGLILRFYDPQDGRVLLDGRDLRALTQASLRRPIALVSQEPFLFNDSVRANIRFGKLDAPDGEIEAAAKMANAHEFIQSLPKGYDTFVGERGVKLSGGQKQRICIARAFLANPRILLLDEATAAVEPESESLIQAALERLMENRTTVIITHRLSMVRGCDRIFVVEDGEIVERGTHDQLLSNGGWYGRMYPMQMLGHAATAEDVRKATVTRVKRL
ncbi:MAG: ABC transporter ATP-binding protein [Planctomycetes bacterium]|nr:ABC transporter ATP-binding protein [Planctomycetota bacterium]